MESIKQISVVIPVYGNENSLQELTRQIALNLKDYTFEIIYVNDASPDNSLEVIKNLSVDYAQVKFIDLPQNNGQQRAILAGLKLAKGEKVAVLDADLQDNPRHILTLYQLLQYSEEVAFVIRKGVYQSFGRMLTSIILKKIIQLLSGLNYKAGSYYLADKVTINKAIILATKCPTPYLSIIVAYKAKRLKYFSAQRAENNGISGYNFTKRLNAGYQAIKCCFYCILN